MNESYNGITYIGIAYNNKVGLWKYIKNYLVKQIWYEKFMLHFFYVEISCKKLVWQALRSTQQTEMFMSIDKCIKAAALLGFLFCFAAQVEAAKGWPRGWWNWRWWCDDDKHQALKFSKENFFLRS